FFLHVFYALRHLHSFPTRRSSDLVWNTKLRSSGGRFFPADGHLDFNPKIYDTFGLDVFRKIVRHELCHYHLYFAGKGYKHADADFKDLLKAVDGLRYAPSLSQNAPANHYR